VGSLKQLRTRIKSVSSTQKITAAMKMVAAAKLKKAQERANRSAPFKDEILKITQKALTLSEMERTPFFITGSDGEPLFILFAADRGLCGGFNATMFKTFSKTVEPYLKNNKKFYCLGVGNRAVRFLDKNFSDYKINLDFSSFEELALHIKNCLNDKKIGSVHLIYTHIKTVINLIPKVEQVIPFQKKDTNTINRFCFFEPSIEEMIDDICLTYIKTELSNAKIQSFASEQASRMTAMDNSTRNAKEMVQNLKLTYNRTRQALITKELIEIISGAKAATS
jgi:F-type H+-transporting ATPase subunit gamma